MEKRYFLPVLAVVETMKWSPDVVMLRSHLPSSPYLSTDACFAQIVLGQGQMFSCAITTRTGTILREQQEAYKTLELCGDLEWILSPIPFSTPPVSQPGQPSVNTVSTKTAQIPVLRVKALSAETLNSLAHHYRRVLLLVDGRRSIEEIARLASKTPQEIFLMLRAMEHLIQL